MAIHQETRIKTTRDEMWLSTPMECAIEMIQELYDPFQNVKHYIKNLSNQFNSVMDFGKIINDCGYWDCYLFMEHRRWWDNCARKIPISYLQAIGAEMHRIEHHLFYDKLQYAKVLSTCEFSRYAFQRISYKERHCIWLPGKCSEKEIVEILTKKAIETKNQCSISSGTPNHIKNIVVNPNTEVSFIYFVPTIKVTNK